jgi:hypothetical protein
LIFSGSLPQIFHRYGRVPLSIQFTTSTLVNTLRADCNKSSDLIVVQGVNYDPMNPMGQSMDESENKDAKAALRATSLVTKYVRFDLLFVFLVLPDNKLPFQDQKRDYV